MITRWQEVINLTIDSDLCGIYNIEPVKLDKLKKILYMLCTSRLNQKLLLWFTP